MSFDEPWEREHDAVLRLLPETAGSALVRAGCDPDASEMKYRISAKVAAVFQKSA